MTGVVITQTLTHTGTSRRAATPRSGRLNLARPFKAGEDAAE